MPITITCKECKHKMKLIDIGWILKGAQSKTDNKIICENCGRVLIEFNK